VYTPGFAPRFDVCVCMRMFKHVCVKWELIFHLSVTSLILQCASAWRRGVEFDVPE